MEEIDTQVHRVSLLRGITKPKEEFEGWREAEKIEGLGWRLVVLSIVSAIVAGLVAYFGTEVLHILQKTPSHMQVPGTAKGIVQGMAVGGAAFGGLVTPVIIMLVMALIFFIFFSDIGYKKLFAIELYLQLIGLIGAIVSGILMAVFQMTTKSFLNLGAITQLLTSNAFINGFCGGISIFLIWKLYVQINAYRYASAKSTSTVTWTLIILNIVFLLIAAGFSTLGHQLTHMVQHMQNLQPPK